MRPDLHWIGDPALRRLAVMPRPRGGIRLEEEIRELRADGVDVVVSLLEPQEALRLGLEAEASLCAATGIEFLSHPIPDHGVPASVDETLVFIRDLHSRIRNGNRAAIHCFAGIGRSGMVAAGVLMLQGVPLPEALDLLAQARGLPMPETEEQKRWLEDLVQRLP